MYTPYKTGPLQHASFIERPNRFIVFAKHDGQQRRTYVANPGKLHEILLPEVTKLLLAHKPHTKTKWEVVAATWDSRWHQDPPRTVFLNTGRVNDVADSYLTAGLVPGLEDVSVIKREHTVGDSRFDFLLDTPTGECLLEVKSVTLVEKNIALFPDATSKRATKHVEELTHLAQNGTRAAILFIVQGQATEFLPDLHNDYDFACALRVASEHLPIFAVAVPPRIDDEGHLCFPPKPRSLTIPWEKLDPILDDAGLYLAVLEVEETATLTIGSLGTFTFPPGFYIYTGSAQKNLSKRMRRHKNHRKRKHWHIDYLREIATSVSTFAIRGARDESALANQVANLGSRHPLGFGATDCPDDGHLVHTTENPILCPDFQNLLTTWRHQNVFAL